MVHHYAEPGFPFQTYFSLSLGYFCSFGILLIVPPDIASVVVSRRSEDSLGGYQSTVDFFFPIYNTFFTTIFILGSIILIFEEYYNTDGKCNREEPLP
jgi:hypothetical protein